MTSYFTDNNPFTDTRYLNDLYLYLDIQYCEEFCNTETYYTIIIINMNI